MSTPIIIDLIFVALLILFAALGAHRGFILTLCSLLAVIVALVGANIVADTLAPKVAESIQPKIEQAISQQLNEALRNTQFTGVSGDAATSPEEIPAAGVLEVLRESKLYQGFVDSVEKALEDGVSATAASAAAQVAAVIAGQIARGLLFIAAFFLILLAWTILSHALDLVAKLPGLNSLNHGLGGIMGFIKGLIILYLAAWALCDLTGVIPRETAEQTHVLSFLLRYSPLDLLSLA